VQGVQVVQGVQGVLQGVQGVQGGAKFQCYVGTGIFGSSTVTKEECKTGVTQCETDFKGNIFFIFLKPENIIKIKRTTMFFYNQELVNWELKNSVVEM
jgi:hypothetical protein